MAVLLGRRARMQECEMVLRMYLWRNNMRGNVPTELQHRRNCLHDQYILVTKTRYTLRIRKQQQQQQHTHTHSFISLMKVSKAHAAFLFL
jgi:hypothetical protein